MLLLSAAVFYASGVKAGTLCELNALPAQLQATELRTESQQYAMTYYRSQLLRYVSGYYSQIAADLLRGEGEYLHSLHILMGSAGGAGSPCTAAYRQLLLQENSAQAFGLALWQMRVAPPGH
ncbi:MAG TPA: hypothetical protein PLF22_01025 [Pseudomonadales bacterium]|nr:hypothetical protein [Pseudomonadales bacterium]